MTDTAIFRVIETTKVGFVDGHSIEEVIWVGTSPGELSEKYPPSKIDDPLGDDLSGGFVRVHYRFEQWSGNGWKPIADPRRRVTPLSQRERAEHRRNFPGDYGDVTWPLVDAGTVSCPSCGCSLILAPSSEEDKH
ncbi:hypothetical protein BRC19_02455 [Candidatus Saccharibacteria bacterium QS_5_54_17]|nr:MAG: hypothetical protein BRC19_02455 [Candidatus Saccharibacteria bacterium QS_5_54_17]